MQSHIINSTASTTNAPITIEDIVVIANRSEKKCPHTEDLIPVAPVGEFGNNAADEKTQLERLFGTIERLAHSAAEAHQKNNFQNDLLLPGRENNITRLITNEFLFYTKAPLTLEEFELLRQRIQSVAQNLPQNLHLILSSFAVKTPEGKIMNVVAHVECGAQPQIHLLVKNHASSIDPIYVENSAGNFKPLSYVEPDRDILPSGFSFDNILLLETAGKAKMFTCVEICVDHGYGIAKTKLKDIFYRKEKKILYAKVRELTGGVSPEDTELFPFQCSHILTANSKEPKVDNILGSFTHVDPVKSEELRETVPFSVFNDFNFGTPVHIYYLDPVSCGLLPEEKLKQIKKMNEDKSMPDPLLEDVLEILQQKIEGDTPLLVAARNGKLEICKALIAAGADLSAQHHRDGMNALLLAAQNGHLDVCKALIYEGADPSVCNYDGMNALQLAAQNGHFEVCIMLIENNAKINPEDVYYNTSLLLYAAEHGHAEVCKKLIAANADLGAHNRAGINALQLAAQNGHINVCSALIEAGADLDAKSQSRDDTAGFTALYFAAKNKHFELCIALIENNAKINPEDVYHNTSLLLYAAEHGHAEVCKKLIAANADLGAHNRAGINALQLAAQNGHTKVCSALIEAGADVNAKSQSRDDTAGFTALHFAIIKGDTTLCKILIDRGANVNVSIKNGISALELAAQYGRTEIYDMISQKEDIAHTQRPILIFSSKKESSAQKLEKKEDSSTNKPHGPRI